VPTRKGLSRARKKRFNNFAEKNKVNNPVESFEPVKIQDSNQGLGNMFD
jgi:hypothetical protein